MLPPQAGDGGGGVQVRLQIDTDGGAGRDRVGVHAPSANCLRCFLQSS